MSGRAFKEQEETTRMVKRVTLFFIAHVLCGFSADPGSARAAVIPFDLGDTGWRVEFDNTKVKNQNFADSILTVTKEFADLQSIDIKFIEINPAAADDFGLRITLNETVKNTSPNINWNGFVLELIDPNPVLEAGDPDGNILGKNKNVAAKHPGFAHFHKDANQTFTPFTPTPNPPNQGDLQGKQIVLADGTFNAGAMRDWKGIGIHQIEEKNQQRNFILRETPSAAPVPEPSTLALFGMSLLSSLACGWRGRRQERL